MKVKCIDNSGLETSLTVGKIYPLQDMKVWIWIIGDDGTYTYYDAKQFEVINELEGAEESVTFTLSKEQWEELEEELYLLNNYYESKMLPILRSKAEKQ